MLSFAVLFIFWTAPGLAIAGAPISDQEIAQGAQPVLLDCEAERLHLVAVETALRDELLKIPRIPLTHYPATPEGHILKCRIIQYSIVNDEKFLENLRRCNGTESKKTELAETIGNWAVEFEQMGCGSVAR